MPGEIKMFFLQNFNLFFVILADRDFTRFFLPEPILSLVVLIGLMRDMMASGEPGGGAPMGYLTEEERIKVKLKIHKLHIHLENGD